MAPSAGAQPERVVHQEYIVRQRYNNTLPPPPGGLKLLDIPTAGLEKYTSPSYGQSLARAQPINIEADAFLGMPIDLIGIPGIFDGDEQCKCGIPVYITMHSEAQMSMHIVIQAPLTPASIHLHDRSLLRPFKTLGQPKTETADVSFLRRTQFITEDTGRRIGQRVGRNAPNATPKKVKLPDDDPHRIIRNVMKGFDVAYPDDAWNGPEDRDHFRGEKPTGAEIEAWKKPKHPKKKNLKVVDIYPLLPDLNAFTDDRGFMVAKFAGVPTEVTDAHDKRMDAGLVRALDPDPDKLADYLSKLEAHDADPTNFPKPPYPVLNYDLFLPNDDFTAANVIQKFDPENLHRDDLTLYTHPSKGLDTDSFRFDYMRRYETTKQDVHDETPYQEVALTLYDPPHDVDDDHDAAAAAVDEAPVDPRQKAAYYYPIMSKVNLQPSRAKYLAQLGLRGKHERENEEETIDLVEVTIRDADEAEFKKREGYLVEVDPSYQAKAVGGATEAEGED